MGSCLSLLLLRILPLLRIPLLPPPPQARARTRRCCWRHPDSAEAQFGRFRRTRRRRRRGPARDPRPDRGQRGQRRRLPVHAAGQEGHQPGRHDRLGGAALFSPSSPPLLSSRSSFKNLDISNAFPQEQDKSNAAAIANFGSRTDTVFCGVFDGHGPYGHLVARRVRDLLPLKLSANLGSDDSIEETPFGCLDEEISVTLESEKKEKQPDIFATLKKSFLKAFKVMDKELKLHGNIDCLYSGTTAVTVVKQDQDLVIGNLGDSRAVLGTRDQNNRLIAVQLTVDLKPNLPSSGHRQSGMYTAQSEKEEKAAKARGRTER
ncbi:putative protein phosphatase 2C 33, partial [Ananas comosus]